MVRVTPFPQTPPQRKRGSVSTRVLAQALLAARVLTVPAAWGQTPLGIEFPVNTYTLGEQFTAPPRVVAMAPDGSFMAVWTSDLLLEFFDYKIFAQRFDASGTPIGEAFQVNTLDEGD